jgi:hypothetical protein
MVQQSDGDKTRARARGQLFEMVGGSIDPPWMHLARAGEWGGQKETAIRENKPDGGYGSRYELLPISGRAITPAESVFRRS